jgi:hypothetical protein
MLILQWAHTLEASAKEWTFSAGAAIVGGYGPLSGDPVTITPVVAVQHAVNQTFWWRFEGGYEHLSAEGSVYEYGLGRATRSTRARFFSFGAGFRWQPGAGASGVAPFVELVPTAHVVHWRDNGPRRDEESMRWVPGFETGVGLRFGSEGPVHLDYGIRYQRSAQFRVESREDRLPGLSQFGLAVALSRAL